MERCRHRWVRRWGRAALPFQEYTLSVRLLMAVLQQAPGHGARLSVFLDDLVRLETIFDDWEEMPRRTVTAYCKAIEALHGEALRRLISALKADPAALAAMKQVARDEVVYAVLRRHDILKPSITERVHAA